MLYQSINGSVKRLLLCLFMLFGLSFQSAAHSAPKTILVLGDSLSAGYGLARGEGWVSLLEQRLQQSKMEAKVINASISGDTSSGGLSRLPALLGKHRPDIVLIELGGNDALRGLSLEASRQNLNRMVELSKAASAKVLLIGMQVPPNYGKTYTEAFAQIFSAVAQQQKVPLLPFLLAGVADKNELFQPDRIHPLAIAHPRILDNVWPYLNKLLKAK